MKLFSVPVLLAASAAADGTMYTPVNDVTSHSKILLDVVEMQDLIDTGNITEAMTVYTEGKYRKDKGKTVQMMAQKDWLAAGLEDTTDNDNYASLFRQDHIDSTNTYLETYNMDAMNCDGSFANESQEMCKISAKKNLICTALSYSLYEGISSIQYGNEKNWDEFFAFWHGVYDEEVDSRVGEGGPYGVQVKRDNDFKTDFHIQAMEAAIEGQKAYKNGVLSNQEKLQDAYDAFAKANLATFAQATIKYAKQFEDPAYAAKIDNKWGEGYTYFRCGAGLMRGELASYIDWLLDPRKYDSAHITRGTTQGNTSCKILKKMLSLPEIGQGLQVSDLNLEAYFPDIKEQCEIESFDHVEGAFFSSKKSGNVRTWIPVLSFILVCSVYVIGYFKIFRAKRD